MHSLFLIRMNEKENNFYYFTYMRDLIRQEKDGGSGPRKTFLDYDRNWFYYQLYKYNIT